MAGASGCNACMDRDEAAVAATGLLAKLIMPEDKVMMKEIWKEIPHTLKYLRLANDSFEYEPEKRAGAAACIPQHEKRQDYEGGFQEAS